MIRFRLDQLTALNAIVERNCDLYVARHVRHAFPDFAKQEGDSELEEWVGKVREGCGRHGIVEPRDVATVAGLTILHGPDFFETPWAADVFAIPTLDGTQKMEVIRRRAGRSLPRS